MDDIVSYVIGKKKGGITPTGEIDITQNGITNVSGYATANVQVPEKQLEEKSVTISSNTTTLIEPSTGKDGMSSVSVTTNIPEPSGKITITQNGTGIDVSSYASADVNVPAGADLSDYFGDTVSQGTVAYNVSISTTWLALIKKLPELTVSGNTLSQTFTGFTLSDVPDITNLSDVTSFNQAFYQAKGLVKPDFSNWTFSQNTNYLQNVFEGCTNLEEISLPGLGITHPTTRISSMFGGCTKLKKIDLSNFAPRGLLDVGYVFRGCTSLEEIDISSMTMPSSGFTTMFTGVPDNCLILVKDQTAKDWFTTNWSNLTNVQIKSEYIANQGA